MQPETVPLNLTLSDEEDEAHAGGPRHAHPLPRLQPGARLEYGTVDGKRGLQAHGVLVLEEPQSVVRSRRRPADDMVVIVEDVIRLLESASTDLRRGHYPANSHARKIAAVLRKVAENFDA